VFFKKNFKMKGRKGPIKEIAEIYSDIANGHTGNHAELGAKIVAAQKASQGKSIDEILESVAQDNIGNPELGKYVVAAKEGFNYYHSIR
jgi:hypothetical protein